MMRIAVDARELCGHPTGVGRYLSRVLHEWGLDESARTHRYILYAHDPVSLPPGLPGEVRVLRGSGGTRWEQVTLSAALSADAPDVLFAPGYSAPLRARVPVALTIHDVSFLAHPEWFPWRERLRRRVLTAASARRAAVVLTDSAFSAREIAARTGVAVDRVRLIPLGVDPVAPAAGESRSPIILFVGSIFRRRHVPDLIAAFGQLAAVRRDLRLEIVGEDRSFPPEPLQAMMEASGASGRIAQRAWVTDAELRVLYARARVFVFLSEYEGFGLTPLEALSAGVPPVVLDTPVAREIYGPAARFVPRGDIAGTVAAIAALLDDTPERQQVLDAAPAVLGRYDWARTARQTLEAIVEAARMSREGFTSAGRAWTRRR